MSSRHSGPHLDRRKLLAGSIAGLCLRPLDARAQPRAIVTELTERLLLVEGLGGNIVVWFDRGSAVVSKRYPPRGHPARGFASSAWDAGAFRQRL